MVVIRPSGGSGGVTSLTAGTGISVSASTGAVTITNIGVTSAVAGNSVTVSGSTGAVTFDTIQDIRTTASPNFTALTISGHSSLNYNASCGAAGIVFLSDSTHGICAYFATDNTIAFYSRAGADSSTVQSFYMITHQLTITGVGNSIILPSTGYLNFNSHTAVQDLGANLLAVENFAGTGGVVFKLDTADTIIFQNLAHNAYGKVDALAYKASGTLGLTGTTCTAFTGGICTAGSDPDSYLNWLLDHASPETLRRLVDFSKEIR